MSINLQKTKVVVVRKGGFVWAPSNLGAMEAINWRSSTPIFELLVYHKTFPY